MLTVTFYDAGHEVYSLGSVVHPDTPEGRCRLLHTAYKVAAAQGIRLDGIPHRFSR